MDMPQAAKRQVLLISYDAINDRMAGPAIRYFHLARVLASYVDLVLASPRSQSLIQPNIRTGQSRWDSSAFQIVHYNHRQWSTLQPFVETADVIILPPDAAHDFPQLAERDSAFVIDGYDPLVTEWLAMNEVDLKETWQKRMEILESGYRLGDFFICASERQRDRWLGLLEANGRVNPWTYDGDPSLRHLVDVVPYGLSTDEPHHTEAVVKGVWPGIGIDDPVILWGGGLWSWLDPITAVRAMQRIWSQRQDVRLIFPGTRHPNPMLAGIPTHYPQALALAKELNLLDRAIFFGEWVAYEQWHNVLLESDIALNLHNESVETRFSFRSRILEYFWARLPVVTTRGDTLSQLISENQLGAVVDYGDIDGVAAAILGILNNPSPPSRQARFEQIRRQFQWEEVARPLIAFCRQPRRAADRCQKMPLGNASYLAREELLHKMENELTDAYRESARLEVEVSRLHTLLYAYERGRFMQFMHKMNTARRWLQTIWEKLRWA